MSLVHMISRENSGLLYEGLKKVGVAFEVNKINIPRLVEAERLIFDICDESKPFTIIGMAKNRIVRRLVPGPILQNTAKVFMNKGFGLSTIHILIITSCYNIFVDNDSPWTPKVAEFAPPLTSGLQSKIVRFALKM